MRIAVLIVVFAVQALVLSACTARAADGPASDKTSAAATVPSPAIVETQTIDIVMRDHSFEPATVRLKTGQAVRLQLRNEGLVAHAIMVGRELQRLTWGPDERLDQDFFQGVEVTRSGSGLMDKHRGTEVTVYPGGTAALTFTVPAGRTGEWEIGCLLPGHYESGMRGVLIVE